MLVSDLQIPQSMITAAPALSQDSFNDGSGKSMPQPCRSSSFTDYIRRRYSDATSAGAADSFPTIDEPIISLPAQYMTEEEANRDSIALRYIGDKTVLLPNQIEQDKGKKTLVVDLDETLVHCSFEPLVDHKCTLPIIVNGFTHIIYVSIRPGAIEFLQRMGKIYEIIIYTASLKAYAHALVNYLDTDKVVRHILCRDSCFTSHRKVSGMRSGTSAVRIVKDMEVLGRDLSKIILVDNTPCAGSLQPSNTIVVTDFIDNMNDDELYRLATFLEFLNDMDDVRLFAKSFQAYKRRSKQIEMQRSFRERINNSTTGKAVQRAIQMFQRGI